MTQNTTPTTCKRAPQFFTDADGQRCARIPLAKRDHFAVLLAEDLADLQTAGVPLNWFFNLNGQRTHGSVRVAIPGDNVRAVARLIMRADAGQQVRFRDNNRMNLVRSNLYLTEGRASVDTGDLLDRLGSSADE